MRAAAPSRLALIPLVRSVDDAVNFEEQVARLQQDWRAALGTVPKGSAAELLIGALPGAPVVSLSEHRQSDQAAVSSARSKSGGATGGSSSLAA